MFPPVIKNLVLRLIVSIQCRRRSTTRRGIPKGFFQRRLTMLPSGLPKRGDCEKSAISPAGGQELLVTPNALRRAACRAYFRGRHRASYRFIKVYKNFHVLVHADERTEVCLSVDQTCARCGRNPDCNNAGAAHNAAERHSRWSVWPRNGIERR